jgi:DNA-directed RNA polymerase subunit M/transcription elongation factor TFIIS
MKCPFCKRKESETEIRQLKSEKEVRLGGTQTVRCMACGWKWTHYPYGLWVFKLKEFFAKW